MIRHPDSNLQIAEKIELALSSQNKRVNTEGTNIVTNEFNREDYVINKAQTETSLQSLAQGKQDVLTDGNGININNNNVISVVWDWIKDKISSILGLTSSAYGGEAATAGTADKVANAITFSNDGAGAASGSTFDGSAARKLSYNSIGAQQALSETQLAAVNSKITTPAVIPRAIAATPSGDPPYSHTVYYTGGSVSSFISQGEAFLAVFDEMTISSATYWAKTSGSANRNGGRLNGVALPSTPMTLPSGIYLVAVHNDTMKNIYSLDYLLDKILS